NGRSPRQGRHPGAGGVPRTASRRLARPHRDVGPGSAGAEGAPPRAGHLGGAGASTPVPVVGAPLGRAGPARRAGGATRHRLRRGDGGRGTDAAGPLRRPTAVDHGGGAVERRPRLTWVVPHIREWFNGLMRPTSVRR